MKAPSRTWQKDALLLLCSVTLSLLVGEAGARVLLRHPARVNPAAAVLGHLNRPDPMIGWLLSSAPIQYRHRLVDSAGKLQYDVSYSVADEQRRTSENPPDAPLVIASGCSFTFGHGLNDQDTWPWLLQERLPEYHVVNVGTMGYGTDQALLAAERRVLQSPQRTAAVVLGFGDFQIERNRGPQGWLATVYPNSKPLYARGPNGPEYRRQVEFWNWGVLTQHSDLIAHMANKAGNLYYRIPSHNEARQITLGLITEFAERMKKRGIQFGIVMLAYAGDQEQAAVSDRKFMLDGLLSANIPVLEPKFRRLTNGELDEAALIVSPIDRHPNRAYNVALISQLTPFLESSGIIETHFSKQGAGALAKVEFIAGGK